MALDVWPVEECLSLVDYGLMSLWLVLMMSLFLLLEGRGWRYHLRLVAHHTCNLVSISTRSVLTGIVVVVVAIPGIVRWDVRRQMLVPVQIVERYYYILSAKNPPLHFILGKHIFVVVVSGGRCCLTFSFCLWLPVLLSRFV